MKAQNNKSTITRCSNLSDVLVNGLPVNFLSMCACLSVWCVCGLV